ncbi:uncharacterized protein B0I36DRAFT_436802 [Microdochium trichocladiopsis]|uniref:Uncharacterized protein n=1 Tax=Microdochium trichocladiopsis TaxID=1682393 RepID=A0A9P8XQR8_9PEZI|nr:uncharacterized protein B0I36DRAFT_436802 [Microdochium trichocladiopsis]KAH7012264.1 hypothetical protein B0I36DRAFT_436802 [Microdochium trichocladiopsis]
MTARELALRTIRWQSRSSWAFRSIWERCSTAVSEGFRLPLRLAQSTADHALPALHNRSLQSGRHFRRSFGPHRRVGRPRCFQLGYKTPLAPRHGHLPVGVDQRIAHSARIFARRHCPWQQWDRVAVDFVEVQQVDLIVDLALLKVWHTRVWKACSGCLDGRLFFAILEGRPGEDVSGPYCGFEHAVVVRDSHATVCSGKTTEAKSAPRTVQAEPALKTWSLLEGHNLKAARLTLQAHGAQRGQEFREGVCEKLLHPSGIFPELGWKQRRHLLSIMALRHPCTHVCDCVLRVALDMLD